MEELLKKIKNKYTAALEKELFEKFLINELKVPAINLKKDGRVDRDWKRLDNDEDRRIKIIKDSKGRDSIPVFTNEKYLSLWIPEGSFYLTLHGNDLIRICLMNQLNSIVINPSSDLSFEILKENIEALASRN